MYKFLSRLVASFFVMMGLFVIGSMLQANTTPEERNQRLALSHRDISAWRAGIRRDHPLMYQTTKTLYYGGYVQCMLDSGHPILPLP